MEKNLKSIYKFLIIILLLVVLLFFIQNANHKNLISIIGFGILLLIGAIKFKKNKDTNFFRHSAFSVVFAVLTFYFIIISLLGLVLGFSKTLFSLNPEKWMRGLIPVFFITIFSERLKYILIKNNKTEKTAIYLLTALMAVFNIFLVTNFFTMNTASYKIFVYICTTVIPIIAQEMLSTYIIFNYGFLPAIGYKLIINLYIYILPIFTALGDYLYSAANVIIPFTIYITLKKWLKSNEDIRREKQKLRAINLGFITIPIIIFLIIIIILVSGIFNYQMIAIASNSMEPLYERGDAIIFERIDKNDIETGDIIVFKKDNIILAHRVVRVREDYTKKYFYTKGDANKSVDSGYVVEDAVLGVVRNVVKFIGYPTVWLNELFER